MSTFLSKLDLQIKYTGDRVNELMVIHGPSLLAVCDRGHNHIVVNQRIGKGNEAGDRAVFLKLYEYIQNNSTSTPTGKSSEIAVKFIDALTLKDNKNFNESDFATLNDDGYKYIQIDNIYIKGLFNRCFDLCGRYVFRPSIIGNADKKALPLSLYDRADTLLGAIRIPFHGLSLSEIVDMYDSAVRDGNVILAEELAICMKSQGYGSNDVDRDIDYPGYSDYPYE